MSMAIALVAAVLIAGVAAFAKWRYDMSRPSGFKKRRALNSSEQTLYWRLVKMLPDHVVLPQLPYTRCMVIKGPALQKLRREKVDFVICNRSMQIVAAIELFDREDASPREEALTRLKEEACEAAGIQWIRWHSNPTPTEAFITMEMNNYSWFQTRLVA